MFHIIRDVSLITVGLDITKHSIQNNIANNTFLCVKLFRYSPTCTFDTNIPLSLPDASHRTHVMFIKNIGKSIKCMHGVDLRQATVRDPIRFAKHVYKVTLAVL